MVHLQLGSSQYQIQVAVPVFNDEERTLKLSGAASNCVKTVTSVPCQNEHLALGLLL